MKKFISLFLIVSSSAIAQDLSVECWEDGVMDGDHYHVSPDLKLTTSSTWISEVNYTNEPLKAQKLTAIRSQALLIDGVQKTEKVRTRNISVFHTSDFKFRIEFDFSKLSIDTETFNIRFNAILHNRFDEHELPEDDAFDFTVVCQGPLEIVKKIQAAIKE